MTSRRDWLRTVSCRAPHGVRLVTPQLCYVLLLWVLQPPRAPQGLPDYQAK